MGVGNIVLPATLYRADTSDAPAPTQYLPSDYLQLDRPRATPRKGIPVTPGRRTPKGKRNRDTQADADDAADASDAEEESKEVAEKPKKKKVTATCVHIERRLTTDLQAAGSARVTKTAETPSRSPIPRSAKQQAARYIEFGSDGK